MRDELARKSRIGFALTTYLALAGVGGLGVLGKVNLLHAVSADVRPLILVFLSVWISSALLWRVALRFRHILAPVVLCGLIGCPLLVFPHILKMHATGRGSDQPDCIIIVSDKLAHREWPYDSSQVWSHNPLSCGPGWVALQAPLVQAFSYQWTLVVVFVITLIVLARGSGWDHTAALLALLSLAPGLWIAACDGTDFLPFGFCVAAIYAVTARSERRSLTFTFVLSLITQFRVTTLLLPAVLSKRIGKVPAIAASAIAITTEAAFLSYAPARFVHDGPLHILSKSIGKDFSQGSPIYLIFSFVFFAIVFTMIAFRVARRFTSGTLLLCYMLCIFAVPALINLVATWRHYGLTVSSLGLWEGGNWMVGCLPLSALLLVREWSLQAHSRPFLKR